jgi:LAS superfamily LD-carboxypeptidase LdcB
MTYSIDSELIFGLSEKHITALPRQADQFIHAEILDSWEKLYEMAQQEGITLKAVSSYRSFERQKNIWNQKASGSRPLLDAEEGVIPFTHFNLEDEDSCTELLHTILRWSALPGLSRHHWGTELDLIDEGALLKHPQYQVQLTPSEYYKGGIFEHLGNFLTENIEATDFFRPYRVDLGGVAPEPWHLSHRQLSQQIYHHFSQQEFYEFLLEHKEEIALIETILIHLDEILERYFERISL